MVDKEERSERAELVKSIDKSSQDLQSQLQRFIRVADHFKIRSFYERKKSRKLIKVGYITGPE